MFVLKGSRTERLQLVNAVRGSNRPCAPHFLELDPKQEDVEFDLIELEQIPVGDPFALVVTITVRKRNTDNKQLVQTLDLETFCVSLSRLKSIVVPEILFF